MHLYRSGPRRDDLGLRSPDIFVDVLAEHVHRHVAAKDNGVVEGLDVELRSERRLRPVAEAVDRGVTDLVAARLAGPAAVAIDFAPGLGFLRAVLVDEEADAGAGRSCRD